jgi:hypothetical protein
MHIEVDDLSREAVHALLAEHLADMPATSPPDSVHALDLTGLAHPAVTLWTVWDQGFVLGCAALKELHLSRRQSTRAGRHGSTEGLDDETAVGATIVGRRLHPTGW